MSDSDLSLTSDDECEVSKNIVGKIFNNKYLCLKYLGRGTFSRVWLVNDLENNEFYAMKAVFEKYKEDGKYEISINNMLAKKNDSRVVKLIASFDYNNQIYLITELMGVSLIDFIENDYDEISPDIIKKIMKDILNGLSELHSSNLLHNDLKLENVITNVYSTRVKQIMDWVSNLHINDELSKNIEDKLPEDFREFNPNKRKKIKRKVKQWAIKNIANDLEKRVKEYNLSLKQIKEIEDIDDIDDCELNNNSFNMSEVNIDNLVVKIIDLGNSEHIDKIKQDYIQIRQYRPPENTINNTYGFKSDIWALGCMFYELFTNEYLFKVDDDYRGDIEKDRAYLHEMYRILGKMPRDMALDCEYSKDYFDNKGRIINFKNVDYTSLEDILCDIEIEDKEGFIDLLKNMLQYDPKKRFTCNDCLNHRWLI